MPLTLKNQRLLRLARWMAILVALVFGVMTTRVAVVGANPCGSASTAKSTVISPTMESPFQYGLISGLTLGSWPSAGYGQIDSCVFSDVGVGIPLAAFKTVRLSGAYAWAAGRGLGFALFTALAWWALSWFLRAVLSLWRFPETPLPPSMTQNPK